MDGNPKRVWQPSGKERKKCPSERGWNIPRGISGNNREEDEKSLQRVYKEDGYPVGLTVA